MAEEKWKSIKGYENEYRISNLGNVFSLRNGSNLRPSVTEKGYLRVCLQKDGEKKWKRIHRLVAEMFIPNPEEKPTVNHINNVRNDNRVCNLEWATMSEQNREISHRANVAQGIYNSDYIKRKMRPVMQLTDDGKIVAVHESMNAAARALNSTVGNIYMCCNGQRNSCRGFRLKYA